MKTLIDRYHAQFKQLRAKDQRMLLVLAVFLVLLIAYGVVWQPIQSFRSTSLEDRERNLALLTMMKQTEAQARAGARSEPMQAFDGNLLSAITDVANAEGVTPNRLQPEGESSVSLWFEAVAFSALVQLLDRLDREQGIGVDQMVIDRTEVSGAVRARLVLSRGEL